jgi:hypothetical protein
MTIGFLGRLSHVLSDFAARQIAKCIALIVSAILGGVLTGYFFLIRVRN